MKIFTFDIEKYSNSNWRCRGHLAIVLAAAIYEKNNKDYNDKGHFHCNNNSVNKLKYKYNAD